ncbi:MAG: SPOR domain-containing protein [Burkholderiaceae bacterium]|jgi:DedD protein|nr:SPOR domain-containing protein [Burkholderiaceae bacterium]MCO5104686.1 SPOR domain-containing protein [Burkholderiaceae bacterium]
MAFFKIRWPGQATAQGKPAKLSRAVRGETVEVMRRRARHRLMGAALLVLIGVVGFPLVFDTQPRPMAVDTRIEIPDRDKVAPLVVPAPPAVATAPVDPALASQPAAKPEPEPKTSELAPEKMPTPAVSSRKDPAASALVEARPQPAPAKAEAAPSPSSPVSPPPLSEAERALALLEGRSGKTPVAASRPETQVAGTGERFIVQVGAFSEESKVREARQKLERAGLATYTQVVETKEGKRTRVRVGPFQGRAEAEKATARIKALGLPASILSL